jgi:hypothetical protein
VELRAFYDQLRDGARLLERVTNCQTPGVDTEAAWRAQQATRDALVCVYRLQQRCDAAGRLLLLLSPRDDEDLVDEDARRRRLAED